MLIISLIYLAIFLPTLPLLKYYSLHILSYIVVTMPVGHFLLILISITFLYPALHPNDKDTSMLCRVPTHFEIKNLSTSQFREILLRFGHCVETANHRAHSHHGGYVTLINATPYDWNLTSMHQNEMEYDFPAVIPAGMLAQCLHCTSGST